MKLLDENKYKGRKVCPINSHHLQNGNFFWLTGGLDGSTFVVYLNKINAKEMSGVPKTFEIRDKKFTSFKGMHLSLDCEGKIAIIFTKKHQIYIDITYAV